MRLKKKKKKENDIVQPLSYVVGGNFIIHTCAAGIGVQGWADNKNIRFICKQVFKFTYKIKMSAAH